MSRSVYLDSAEHFNSMPISRRLFPIPSQVLRTKYGTKELSITLNSGATVSYLKLEKAHELDLSILPNNQLALLADKIASVGEVDFLVTVCDIKPRIRALVMRDLQADCFGCTTFHVDNNITTNIKEGTITLHGKFTLNLTNFDPNLPLFPPPMETIHDNGAEKEIDQYPAKNFKPSAKNLVKTHRFNAISLPVTKITYPGETLPIPLPDGVPCAG